MRRRPRILPSILRLSWLKLAEAGQDAMEFFEERAAIRQFDGGMSRGDAMQAALEETLQRFPPPADKSAA